MPGPDSIRLRLMLRGTDMPQWRNRRKYAAESDVRRMYIRGRQGALKVETLPLEQALTKAKVAPKGSPAKPNPSVVRTGVVAVTASEIRQAKSASKGEKRPWSVGRSNSGSVFRPKPQLKRREKKAPIKTAVSAIIPTNVAPNLSAHERRRLRRAGLKSQTRDERSGLQMVPPGTNLSSPPRRNATEHPAARDTKRGGTTAAKNGSAKPKKSSARFDGQPKWERGRRIVQGGLPELGRR